MILCPSCGSRVEGDLRLGCESCGARAVGPPLARPENELPSFGRAGIAFAGGLLMSIGFLSSTIVALIQNKSLTLRIWKLGFWTVVGGGETAAWRLKWIAIPVSIVVLWSSARIIRSMMDAPKKFLGLRFARAGFSSAAIVTFLMALLIGITVPVRLQRRQWAIEAEREARYYTIRGALNAYREASGTYPSQEGLINALKSVPDPDGSIADALRFVDPNGYQPSTMLASAPVKARPIVSRGSALRNVATVSADPPGVPFTNYDLRLVNEHRFLSSDEDLVMRNGAIMKGSELPRSVPVNLSRPGGR